MPEGEGDTGKRVISRNEFCRIRAGGGRGMHGKEEWSTSNRMRRGRLPLPPKVSARERERERAFSVSGITRYICMEGPERERRVFKEREGGIIHVCRDRSPSPRSVARMVCWLPAAFLFADCLHHFGRFRRVYVAKDPWAAEGDVERPPPQFPMKNDRPTFP